MTTLLLGAYTDAIHVLEAQSRAKRPNLIHIRMAISGIASAIAEREGITDPAQVRVFVRGDYIASALLELLEQEHA